MESRLRQNDTFPSKSFLETIEWEKESEENVMTLFEKLRSEEHTSELQSRI